MIALLSSLSAGNSVSILLNPPSTAVSWRLLRNLTGTFIDENDQTLIYSGAEVSVIDIAALSNGTEYFYQPFYFDGTSWSTAPSMSVMPGLTFVNRSVDVLSLVRDRIDVGLAGLIAGGLLQPANGIIPVLTASPQLEDTIFPVVTVHMTSDTEDDQFIGNDFIGGTFGGGIITETDGYMSNVTLEIVVWAKNGDERLALREALKSVLIANNPIFAANELQEITQQFSDMEDFQSYNIPMYMTNCTMRCLAPSAVTNDSTSIINTINSTYSFEENIYG